MPLVLAAVFLGLIALSGASAQEGWVIRSFDARYQVNADGSIDVLEDIQVGFGTLQRHGIFRDIIVEQRYEGPEVPDETRDYNRRYTLSNISVDDGQRSIQFERSRIGAALQLKIGDPDREISGEQRYRIQYKLSGALNAQTNEAELYWNVTGDQWEVAIERATVVVTAPSITRVTCFEGSAGSDAPCQSQLSGNRAQFAASRRLSTGSGLTIVVGMPAGAVEAPPPDLVLIKTAEEKVRDFMGLKPLTLALAGFLGVGGLALVGRYWWLEGRDRWFGDVHYLTGSTKERRRPFFAKDTVVVEYQPPETGHESRRLRPAEIGTLLDEQADTLDVSATIVDLAVRGYLKITEIEKQGVLGFFGDEDYRLEKLKPADAELLEYERLLLEGLFEDGGDVLMSSLKNKFYSDLAKVKEALYKQVVGADKFFAGNPEKARTIHLVAGCVVTAIGWFATFLLGAELGAAIVGVPIILAGLALIVLSRSMPRRTVKGRETFRRALGFREYMVVAETDRQRFYEEENIFEKYLPYAIVYDTVEKWAKAFEGLDGQPAQTSGWYVSSHAFAPLAFSNSISSFSSSLSSAISSTPGGSGGSGFSGGSSGGGGGGGGGGSW